MSNLTQYQVDHLFLLIGGNPLPNYVAAKTLLKPGGVPYFVYSSATETHANALRDILNANNATSMIPLQDESDAFCIQKAIQETLKTIGETERVGLNYTGGKKVMSVHAYQSVKKERADVVCSYLDPDTFQIRIETQQRSVPIDLMTDEVRAMIGMSFETLWKLHSIELNPKKSPPHSTPILPDVAMAIAHHFAEGEDKVNQWKKWANTLGGSSSLDTCPFEDVRQALQSHSPTITTMQELKDAYFSESTDKDPAKKWLDGGWLEDYVLNVLTRIAQDLGLGTPLCNIQAIAKNKSEQYHFEVDVAILRGHQLFVFSCTTKKDRKDRKLRLFEASLRARQLGGDEARFALVCTSDCKENDENDPPLEYEMGSLLPNRNIFHVFYRANLENLERHIKEWIKKVDRDVQR
jgi:hypothetical protein